jgi:hypothetical protein
MYIVKYKTCEMRCNLHVHEICLSLGSNECVADTAVAADAALLLLVFVVCLAVHDIFRGFNT